MTLPSGLRGSGVTIGTRSGHLKTAS